MSQSTKDHAKKIWREALPLDHEDAKLAWRYFESRGLEMDAYSNFDNYMNVRYHKGLSYRGDTEEAEAILPALVFAVTSTDGSLEGVQRVFLGEDGTKAKVRFPKKTLGELNGFGIHFGQAKDTLAIAEGPETAMAVFQSIDTPTISAVSEGGLRKINIPSSVRKVHIWCDHDVNGIGRSAADECAVRLLAQEIEVFIHDPKPYSSGGSKIDWLDVLNNDGKEAFRKSIASTSPLLIQPSEEASSKRKTAFEFKSLADLFNEPPPDHKWLVDGLLTQTGSSLIVAPPKTGKSTLIRNLALAVSRGERFLGMNTLQGPVLYLALEEQKHEVLEHFEEMGADGTEPLHIHAKELPQSPVDNLELAIGEFKPVLVIIDTLMRFTRIKDINDYSQTVNALSPLTDMARTMGFHIAFTHHAKKDQSGHHGEGILGSTGVFGAVDTVMEFRVGKDSQRSFKTIQRYGDDFPDTIVRLTEAKRLEIVGDRVEANTRVTEHEFETQLKARGWTAEKTLLELVQGRKNEKQRILRAMYNAIPPKVDRRGSGKKGSPFEYNILPPSIAARTGRQNIDQQEDALHEEKATSQFPLLGREAC